MRQCLLILLLNNFRSKRTRVYWRNLVNATPVQASTGVVMQAALMMTGNLPQNLQTLTQISDCKKYIFRSIREGSISRKTQEKWKVGAKKALLQWVQAQVSKQLGVQVNDFGPSWRDGNAFLAVVNSIRPGGENINFLKLRLT